MMSGLAEVDPSVLPFVRLFYGSKSRYLWEDNEGNCHTIAQAEGGEQGDPFLPLLFALGQHTLVAVHSRLLPSESLMANLDDNHVVSSPERVEHVHTALEEELFRHCHIRVHAGKTRVWNAAGIRPDACDLLERLAARHNSGPVWRGSEVPTHQQGVKILGTPLGHPELELVATDHLVLLDRIPGVPDVQAAWLLLLHCAQARANYMLRMIPPEEVREFARRHEAELFQCVGNILAQDLSHCGDEVREMAGLPLILGVSNEFVSQRSGRVGQIARAVTGAGFTPPSWRALARRARPHLRDVLDFEPGGQKRGWQHEAASRVDLRFRDEDLFRRVPAPVRAFVPYGWHGSLDFTNAAFDKVATHLFRTILLRRLRQPLPLSECSCRCGST